MTNKLRKFMKTFIISLVLLLGLGPYSTTYTQASESQASTTVKIYYDREDPSGWDVWLWGDGVDGAAHPFDKKDDKGNYAEITLDKALKEVTYIVRKSDWSKREPSDKEDGSRVLPITDSYGESFIKHQVEDKKEEKPKEEKDDKKQAERTVSVTVHFDKKDGGWSLWLWPKDGEGKDYPFTGEDENGKYAEIDIKTDKNSLGFLVKDKDWNKDIGEDRFIDISQGTEIWLKSKDPTIYYDNPYGEAKSYDKLEANVSYRRYDMSTDDIWAIKYWNNKDEANSKIQKLTKDGKYYTGNITSQGSEINKVLFTLVKIDSEGKVIYQDGDVKEIKRFDDTGKAEVYVLQDAPRVFYDKTLVDEDIRVEKASVDSYREINVNLNKAVNIKEMLDHGYGFITNSDLVKEDIEAIGSKDSNNISNKLNIKFKKDLELDKDYEFIFYLDSAKNIKLNAKAVLANIVADKKFDEAYAYDGELGSIYSKEATTFKLWAPTASGVDLVIFGADGEVKDQMKKEDRGVYSYTLAGDQDKTVYMYDIHFKDGSVNRVVDPYAKSTTINGEKAVVVNPQVSMVERPANKYVKNPIIYELHVRDLSNQEYSGIKNRGKFLGLTEEGTKTPNGFKTGLDYIADLGVSHIQLLPIYDYSKNSVNEKNPMDKYNWGYDPVNYDTPEGAYSTDPNNPYARIEELQKAVDAVHKKDMGVIMDVVYNHVFSLGEHSFNKIVPGYYFRFDENGNPHNGTGVGNETASERKMMSKFIVDSVKYWAKTYKLDGFRFDLMGILDYHTMNTLVKELKEINPDIVILGEGWDMGNLPKDQRATQVNSVKMPHVGTFNDDLRDGVKGSAFDGNAKGFVNGEKGVEEKLFSSIKTVKQINGKNYDNPQQLIQYTEAHDNKTVFDKIKELHPNEDDATTLKRQRLATVIPLLSQGRPFIHAGQEFARTKGGNENSYNAPAEVNELDWKRAEEYKDNIEYIKEVIAIRKNEPLFHSTSFDQVDARVNKIVASDGLIAYSLSQGDKDLYIGHNREDSAKEFNLPNGKYKVLIKADKANHKGLETIEVKDGKIAVDPMSTLMLEKLGETKDPEETKKPEDNKKPGKNDDYFFNFAYLNNKLNKKDKPCKMNAKVRKQYYELKKAYHRNLVISKSAKYLLENAPKTVRPVKSKLEKQLALAENLRDQALKYLTELENCYE
ncbi:type I pullulanase [Anaerococcus sp. NML200537]|uniref:type I pullulanase n=1 Tax=Anaerococcus sp. NML200537 TaxID=2954485 RepID=UPI0022381238|nr:type I pullulanase [Anaerococcus sp. NML200537]MCW6700756.1 type I pullulanase [Anaerococcus sp. NML200537]